MAIKAKPEPETLVSKLNLKGRSDQLGEFLLALVNYLSVFNKIPRDKVCIAQ